MHAKYKNTRLKIVGADENGYLNQLCDLVNKLGLNKVVCYGGVEKDMEKFYKSLDVFVLPSVVREAFGLVLYLACNKAKELIKISIPLLGANLPA